MNRNMFWWRDITSTRTIKHITGLFYATDAWVPYYGIIRKNQNRELSLWNTSEGIFFYFSIYKFWGTAYLFNDTYKQIKTRKKITEKMVKSICEYVCLCWQKYKTLLHFGSCFTTVSSDVSEIWRNVNKCQQHCGRWIKLPAFEFQHDLRGLEVLS